MRYWRDRKRVGHDCNGELIFGYVEFKTHLRPSEMFNRLLDI